MLTIPARDILISILLDLGTKSRDYRVVTVVNNNDDGIDGPSGTDGGRRTSRNGVAPRAALGERNNGTSTR
jgi:hypothetical protein